MQRYDVYGNEDDEGCMAFICDMDATIARLTAERDEARATAAAAYERAARVAHNREGHAKGETARACRGIAVSIGMLATEAETNALAELLDAETRACAEVAKAATYPSNPEDDWTEYAHIMARASCKASAAILARIDQRKEAGK